MIYSTYTVPRLSTVWYVNICFTTKTDRCVPLNRVTCLFFDLSKEYNPVHSKEDYFPIIRAKAIEAEIHIRALTFLGNCNIDQLTTISRILYADTKYAIYKS